MIKPLDISPPSNLVMHVLLTNYWQHMGGDILDRKFARIQDWDSKLLYSETLHNTQQKSLKQNEENILRDLC